MKDEEDPKWEDAKKPCKCCPSRGSSKLSVCRIKAIKNNFELIKKMVRPGTVKKAEKK